MNLQKKLAKDYKKQDIEVEKKELKTYQVSINIIRKIQAEDEDRAMEYFEDDMNLSNENLSNYLKVKEIKQ